MPLGSRSPARGQRFAYLRATAQFVARDACDMVAPYLDATAGTITVDALGDTVSGSFEVDFAEGSASGTFGATACEEDPVDECPSTFEL